MIKLCISQQIIKFVKEQRDNKNMNASTFAKRIGKTNAYVTKFEKGDFKTIELTDLYSFIGCIYADNDDVSYQDAQIIGEPIVNKFLDEYILESIVNDESKITSLYKDNDDNGLRNYDEVYRKLKITSELVDYLNKRIEEQELTAEKIVNYCNENNDIDDTYKKNTKLDYNTYYTSEANDEDYIIFHLDERELIDILSKKQDTCSFITILMTLYTLNRMSLKPRISQKSSSLFAYQTLDKYGFRSLNMIRIRREIDKMKDKEISKLNNLPSDTNYVLARMIGYFDYIASLDLNYLINKTVKIQDNLYNDPSMLLSIMDLDLEPIKELSVQKKRELLVDMNNLIKKYSENTSKEAIELL